MTTLEHPPGSLPPISPVVAETSTRSQSDDGRATGRMWPRLRGLLVAAAGYLGLSVFIWWHVWSSHPTSTTTCGCGDSSLFTWFLAWPAYAISHGTNPLYSTALFHP